MLEYLITATGLSGPIGNILKKKMQISKEFPENAAQVFISGRIKSPTITTLLPFVKWGNVRTDLTVDISYVRKFPEDSDNASPRSMNFTSTIDLDITSKIILFGIAGVQDYNEKATREIYSIVEKNVRKEFGY